MQTLLLLASSLAAVAAAALLEYYFFLALAFLERRTFNLINSNVILFAKESLYFFFVCLFVLVGVVRALLSELLQLCWAVVVVVVVVVSIKGLTLTAPSTTANTMQSKWAHTERMSNMHLFN